MSQTKAGNLIKQTNLTSLEIEIIEGCLLGDGTLCESGKQFRLRVEHKVQHQEYVEWKYNLLRRLCVHQPQFVPTHHSLRFGTVGHHQLTSLRHRWYSSKKQIPKDLVLTPLMVAIWFMDDGTRQRNSVDLSIHNFSDQGANYLVHQLSDFGLKTTVNNDGKGNRLYLWQKSYPVFKQLVEPYIVKCMEYKLP